MNSGYIWAAYLVVYGAIAGYAISLLVRFRRPGSPR